MLTLLPPPYLKRLGSGWKALQSRRTQERSLPGLKGAAASHLFVYNRDLFLAQFEQLEDQEVSSRNGENGTGGHGDPMR